jgi:hypothetical protein
LVEDPLLQESPEKTLAWLNTRPKVKDIEEIRKALKRPSFGLPTRSSGDFVHHLEVNRF